MAAHAPTKAQTPRPRTAFLHRDEIIMSDETRSQPFKS
jgi:hypothetical protein